MLLESSRLLKPGNGHDAFDKVLHALSESTRDTDMKGWYAQDSTLGVIFTEFGAETDGRSVARALLTKVSTALSSVLSISEINELRLSFRVFPEDWEREGTDHKSPIYDDLSRETARKRLPHIAKRSMDIVGSLFAVLIGLPLFLAIAVAVKVTSKGPVLFRQKRVGQFGRKFTFLKFRSMRADCDPKIHQEYVRDSSPTRTAPTSRAKARRSTS